MVAMIPHVLSDHSEVMPGGGFKQYASVMLHYCPLLDPMSISSLCIQPTLTLCLCLSSFWCFYKGTWPQTVTVFHWWKRKKKQFLFLAPPRCSVQLQYTGFITSMQDFKGFRNKDRTESSYYVHHFDEEQNRTHIRTRHFCFQHIQLHELSMTSLSA